jgi:hypothetical protein
MEKLNLNFSSGDNILKSICWLLSIISWLFFLITGWISLGEQYYFWTIPKNTVIRVKIIIVEIVSHMYIPSQIDKPLLVAIFILTLVISTFGFCAYLAYSICIKSNVFNGMMESISKFHFIPFACAGGLFIIGETIKDAEDVKTLLVIALILSIIGFISLILVHFKTNMDPWYASLLIKKATFSCLIALFTYSICYTIYQIGVRNIINNYTWEDLINSVVKEGKLRTFTNNCATAFSIVIGAVNLCLAFALKDNMIAIMNLLIYIGCTIYYYNIEEETKKYLKNNGDGVIDIVMIVLSVITCCLIFFMYKTDSFKK